MNGIEKSALSEAMGEIKQSMSYQARLWGKSHNHITQLETIRDMIDERIEDPKGGDIYLIKGAVNQAIAEFWARNPEFKK